MIAVVLEVSRRASRRAPPWLRSDARAAAVLACWAALPAYDAGRGVPLAGYLQWVALGAATGYCARDRVRQCVSIDAASLAVRDRGLTPEAAAAAAELWRHVAALPALQARTVRALYREGESVAEVAAAAGVPVTTIRGRRWVAVRALRAVYGVAA